jgi:hypothetical protein
LTASAAFLSASSSTLAAASTARSAPFTIGHASTP